MLVRHRLIITVVILCALGVAASCHPRTASLASTTAPICAPPAALIPAGRIRLDGWWGPTVNDSVVLVVDGRERWRGVYLPCTKDGATSAIPSWLPSSADSVRNISVLHGDTVRRAFHIGGPGPSAMLIETARR